MISHAADRRTTKGPRRAYRLSGAVTECGVAPSACRLVARPGPTATRDSRLRAPGRPSSYIGVSESWPGGARWDAVRRASTSASFDGPSSARCRPVCLRREAL